MVLSNPFNIKVTLDQTKARKIPNDEGNTRKRRTQKHTEKEKKILIVYIYTNNYINYTQEN